MRCIFGDDAIDFVLCGARPRDRCKSCRESTLTLAALSPDNATVIHLSYFNLCISHQGDEKIKGSGYHSSVLGWKAGRLHINNGLISIACISRLNHLRVTICCSHWALRERRGLLSRGAYRFAPSIPSPSFTSPDFDVAALSLMPYWWS